jgi:hypothetical protein
LTKIRCRKPQGVDSLNSGDSSSFLTASGQ